MLSKFKYRTSYNRVQVLHCPEHIPPQRIALQASFFITLIIIDKFQHIDVALVKVFVDALHELLEILFHPAVECPVKLYGLL